TRHGVAAGDLPVTSQLPLGAYTLRVEPGVAGAFAPETRTVLVLRQTPSPQLEFARGDFRPGEEVEAQFRARLMDNGLPAPNQPITVQAHANGKPIPLGAAAPKVMQLHTDKTGTALIRFPVPKGLPKDADLRLKVQAHDGVSDESVTRRVPLAPPGPAPAPL